jgi:DNA-binding XRE family transcriptional regulator
MKLRQQRRMVGLTQHQVAQQADIPINRIVFAETGRIALRPDEEKRIAKVLKTRAQKAFDAVSQ